MSLLPAREAECTEGCVDEVETLIVPRSRDIGNFEVHRVLPAPDRQMVGPFIFFDQMGPAELIPGDALDVRPHPHIGLGTVTYLHQGSLRHRDSLGTDIVIEPGAVNWMVAGRGITHSERTPDEVRRTTRGMLGIQTWIALPEADEETDPSFEHIAADELPELRDGGANVRLILGNAWGSKVETNTFSELFYASVELAPGASVPVPDDHEDRGAHVLKGAVFVGDHRFEAGRMLVFRPGKSATIRAGEEGATLMLLGGATLDGPRYIWWNFVASSREKIEAAKEAWKSADFRSGRFTLPPGDDADFIPL